MDHTTTPPPSKPEPAPEAQTGKTVTTTPPPAKPETAKPPKTKTTKAPAPTASGTEPTLINPAWASHVIKKYDLVGKTAERAVSSLTTAIEKQVKKATTPEKLEKLVLAAIAESYRNARG